MKIRLLVIIKTTLYLVSIVFLFYWFQIRPAEIRKACVNDLFQVKYDQAGVIVLYGRYNICLARKGLPFEASM